MKAELKQKWIEALTGGKYLQGRGRLKKSFGKSDDSGKERYCCLGVLCEVGGKTFEKDDFYFNCEGKSFELSNSLLKEFGLSPYHQNLLIDLNDIQVKDFKRIADWIEENIKGE